MNAAGLATPVHADEREGAHGAGGLAGHRRHRVPTDHTRIGVNPSHGGFTMTRQGPGSTVVVNLMMWAAMPARGPWSV